MPKALQSCSRSREVEVCSAGVTLCVVEVRETKHVLVDGDLTVTEKTTSVEELSDILPAPSLVQ
jgi:hypothetical protein